MDIATHQRQQADKASQLAEALTEFLNAHDSYAAAMTSWNESNAKEGSSRWQQLEAAVDEEDKPRQASARTLLRLLEEIAGIRYDVVRG